VKSDNPVEAQYIYRTSSKASSKFASLYP